MSFYAVSYFPELFWRALSDSWHVFPGKGVVAVMIPGAITLALILWKHRQKQHQEAKLQFRDWLKAICLGLLAFTTIFSIHFLILTPKTMVEESRRGPSVVSPSAPDQAELERLRSVARRFEDKEKKEAARKWTPLTPKQIKEWADTLRPYHIPAFYVFLSYDADARELLLSLEAMSEKAGIPAFEPGLGMNYPPGEIIISSGPNNPVAPVLVRLFSTLGCTVKLEENRSEAQKEITISIGARQPLNSN